MRSGGRPPQPTALKILKGNPGRRPLNKHEPQPTGIPAQPAFLDDVAAAEWCRIVPLLTQCGMLGAIDVAGLTGYCQAWSRYIQAELDLRTSGTTYMQGAIPCMHPNVKRVHEALLDLKQFIVEFGLTPSSRSRIKVDQPVPRSKIDEFRERHGG